MSPEDVANDLVYQATVRNVVRNIVWTSIVNPAIEIALLRDFNRVEEQRRTQSMLKKPPMTPMTPMRRHDQHQQQSRRKHSESKRKNHVNVTQMSGNSQQSNVEVLLNKTQSPLCMHIPHLRDSSPSSKHAQYLKYRTNSDKDKKIAGRATASPTNEGGGLPKSFSSGIGTFGSNASSDPLHNQSAHPHSLFLVDFLNTGQVQQQNSSEAINSELPAVKNPVSMRLDALPFVHDLPPKRDLPFNIKLHIQNKQPYELTEQEIRLTMHQYAKAKANKFYQPELLDLKVKVFAAKNQTKIFVKFDHSKEAASVLFRSLYRDFELAFLNVDGTFKFKR